MHHTNIALLVVVVVVVVVVCKLLWNHETNRHLYIRSFISECVLYYRYISISCRCHFDCKSMTTTGACPYNRPCAQQYVGKSQSCMVI
eukprot:COSAG05_NODE_4477_length_1496_cov_3.491768_1_plen_87_part_10